MVKPAAISELSAAFHTPSMRTKVMNAANETSVGRMVFGHLNAPRRPPNAPSATR